jgi:hypothetical protein
MVYVFTRLQTFRIEFSAKRIVETKPPLTECAAALRQRFGGVNDQIPAAYLMRSS